MSQAGRENIQESQLNQLRVRLDKIENSVLDEFNDVQLSIELIEPDELQSDERDSFENVYYELITAAKDILAPIDSQSQMGFTQTNSAGVKLSQVSHNAELELKKFNLPTFAGEYDKWYKFKNTFISLVDNNSKFDNVQKFYRLLECLRGDAEKVLKELEVSDENYKVAWEMLIERFEDKQGIIQKHLKSLIDLDCIQKDTVSDIRAFLDEFNSHWRALKSLGEPIESWDRMLILLMSRKMPNQTKTLWNDARVGRFKGEPTINDFKQFLNERCKSIEALTDRETSKKMINSQVQHSHVKREAKLNSYVATTFQQKCKFCNGSHYTGICEKLKSLSVENRWNEIKSLKLCCNCLRSNHFVKDCYSQGCKVCGRKHNTILHGEFSNRSNNTGQTLCNPDITTSDNHAVLPNQISEPSTSVSAHCSAVSAAQILLATATIYILGNNGAYFKARCLLDSGSQACFMSEKLLKILKLPTSKLNLPLVGVTQVKHIVKLQTKTKIKSICSNYETFENFLVVEKITANLPNQSFDISNLKFPSGIKLADENFNISCEIDVLLNARIFFEILQEGQINLGACLPILQNTRLGWIVAGPLNTLVNANDQKKAVCNLAIFQELNDIEKFWKIEEYEPEKLLSREERECEVHFKNTVRRDSSGKFVVTLPTRDNFRSLGDSIKIAENRMSSMERKFSRNAIFREKYVSFLREYEALGHMQKISDEELLTDLLSNDKIYYLPHHGVLNESSSTTKLRVVFDGTAKPPNGLALNDVLQVGPCIQDDLFSILCRFRWPNVVVTADIEKMYRMVNVTEGQHNLQRILWRESAKDKMQHFKLKTVTYGTGSASFLATRCLKEIANHIADNKPEVSKSINRDFYVDDLITGGTSESEVIALAKEISQTLTNYGFNLRKWNSNSESVVQHLAGEDCCNLGRVFHESDSSKTLGIFWNAKRDELEYIIKFDKVDQDIITKRQILSLIARIFDPLGLIGPVITRAKLIMQRLWQARIGWDDAVPSEIVSMWHEFEQQIFKLHLIKIPRHVACETSVIFELHGFCDASEKASGACVYLRCVDSNNCVSVKLLCSKSRVAPLKTISLPRLELCGAVLLIRLMKRAREAVNISISTFFWCDSTIVLCWLAEEPHIWKSFVANRVSEIQSACQISDWNHVASKQNPADTLSRGSNPEDLLELNLWWHGPQFLFENPINNNFSNENLNACDVPERKKVKLTVFYNQNEDFTLIERFSNFSHLQRVTAWILRFSKNCTLPLNQRINERLSVNELEKALQVLIKIVQIQYFAKEISYLEKGKPISKASKIKCLDPFLDEFNILRVGGRLRRAKIEFDRKFQIILPYKSHLTKLIIRYEHLRLLHAGPQATLNSVRQKFWPINGRRAIRSVLSKCLVCFKAKPISAYQKMGDLPFDRVNQLRPFYACGTDFAGPFFIKDGKLRNRAIIKAYMCIFICFATKAVHIEAVGDLTTESFLNAFKRFISRRGLCKRIYSDNGSNYIGSNRELKEIQNFSSNLSSDDNFSRFCDENKIEWSFIPAKSPHQGGIWESAIKSAKYHAQRIVGNTHLTFEELSTIFSMIEAVLNSRPLTELSPDPSDLNPLTPGHFLIGSPLTALPELDVQHVSDNRASKYQLLQKLHQHFWTRWSHEYLCTLQRRNKWSSIATNVPVGSLVLLKEENLPPLNWKLGRVLETFPGADGSVRVVSIKTNNGVFKRAVQNLCVLPIYEQ